MALTEPGGGTDILGSLSTFAEEKQDRWVINGEKVFITAAHASDYMITICKTEADAKPSKSLSVFLVPSDSKGISITRIPKISCHHCDSVGITFSNVEIPHENILGTKGNGWYEMLTVLNPERIGCAMMGVGLMAAAYEDAFAYAKQRACVRRTHQPVSDSSALSGGHLYQPGEFTKSDLQSRMALRSGQALPPGIDHGQAGRFRRRACMPGDSEPKFWGAMGSVVNTRCRDI